jgi:hypothetical protein
MAQSSGGQHEGGSNPPFVFYFAAERRGVFMGLAGSNVQFVDRVVLGVNNITSKLNVRPTLVVSRSTAEPATKSIGFAGNIAVLNFIAGCNAILQTATMTNTATYLFLNSQPGVVTLTLDNGGKINGQSTPYILAFGAPIEFQFDGTNLN